MNQYKEPIENLLECLTLCSSAFSELSLILKNKKEVILLDKDVIISKILYKPFGLYSNPEESITIYFYINAEVKDGLGVTWDLEVTYYEMKKWLVEHSVSAFGVDSNGPIYIQDFGYSIVDSHDELKNCLAKASTELLAHANSYDFSHLSMY